MQTPVSSIKFQSNQRVAPGRKSLLACAVLAMLTGNQAMAESFTDTGGTPIDQSDVTGILIDDTVGGAGGVGNIILIDAANASITIEDGSSGSSTTIGTDQSTFNGDVTVNNANVNLTNGGSLSVDGSTSVTTLSATDVTANTVTAATVDGTTVNSATVNGTTVNSATVNGTTVNSATVNGTTVNSATINNTGAITTGAVNASTVNGTIVNSTNIVNSGSITSGTLQADTVSATTINGGTITGALNADGNKITNVAAGTAGSDAVNYDQLSAVQNGYNSRYDELANQTNARYNYLDNRIDKVEEVANAGIASVAALAAIPAPAYGKRFSVGAGLGNYSSESAVAIGFRAAITESTSVTAGVSRNTASKTAANLGVGYSW
ncbi:MAG: YadA family autotransporter adhesin [Pseudomonas sp.]